MNGQGSSASQDEDHVKQSSTRCYYEVLGVHCNASDSGIKKAYRMKALEVHPDRNLGDAENATAKFAETQTAYEVLINRDSRKWYDSLRKSSLQEKTSAKREEIIFDLRYKFADDIYDLTQKFAKKLPFNDEPSGFYRLLAKTFAEIASDEASICQALGQEPMLYPTFGSENDNYETSVKQFYRVWTNFSTQRINASQYIYVSDLNSKGRRQRKDARYVEMKNNKIRKGSIKEFNNAVREFVVFVRELDPRYALNLKSSKSQYDALLCASEAQSVRSRTNNQARSADYIVPDWVNFRDPSDKEEVEDFILKSDESLRERTECIVCEKRFKSKPQYQEHEKSKKHIKAVKQLRLEMEQEMKLLILKSLNLDEPSKHVEYVKY